MKNSLAFKFIAIVLCAASLVGAIGSITGVIALTSADLYNKSVSQIREERLTQDAEHFSYLLAQMYASSNLGGCPETMVTDTTGGTYWLQSQYPDYGYVIYDAEGNLLSSYNEAAQNAASYTFSASGQYMYLISVESDSQLRARETREQMAVYTQEAGASEVPAEGIVIQQVKFLDSDGRIIYTADGDGYSYINTTYFDDDVPCDNHFSNIGNAGYLFYNTNGELVFQSFLSEEPILTNERQVAEYFFLNHEEGFVLTAHNPDGLGTLAKTNGKLRFVSYFTQPATVEVVEETIPEETTGWSLETVPGAEDRVTVIAPDGTPIEVTLPQPTEPEETVPQTTEAVAVETAPAETVEETIPSSASAIPETTSPIEETVYPPITEATEAPEPTVPATVSTEPPVQETTPAEETVPAETEPVYINGKPLEDYQINTHRYYDPESSQEMTARYVYVPMPEMTVTLYLNADTMQSSIWYDLLTLIQQFRSYLLPAIGICLLVFAILAVYLCTAAGRKPKCEEVLAGGLNRLPLDLYFFCACFTIACIAAYAVEGTSILMQRDFFVGCSFAVGSAFLASLIFVAFCFAFVAQLKTPAGFWWRNTLCGHSVRLLAKFAVWLETFLATRGFPFLGRMIKAALRFTCKSAVWMYHATENSLLWIGTKLGRIFRWMGHKLHRFFSLLPLTWQWLLAGFVIILSTLLTHSYNTFLIMLGILIPLAILLYASHCFGLLSESTKRMSKGDLDTKVDSKLMGGCFKDFASDLNDLADVAVVAAQKQLKSERMKTELITNVSHDIKTPLTSIINYVDLLQKPHTPEDEQQYLEVLDRQSQRLKKLIDDLMDMSKANTGNMQVDITRLDAVESVNQALGEFADKLDKARLIPVFRHDDAQVPMMADGRLVWRVLSNLLSNAVKYAMPGTRLYVDLMTLEGKVVISLKNISREELNIDADELMERFVRGDDSRNTEGSGLGLNIAKSLMELQKGQLQLLVDGDLFKVTLIFPGA